MNDTYGVFCLYLKEVARKVLTTIRLSVVRYRHPKYELSVSDKYDILNELWKSLKH